VSLARSDTANSSNQRGNLTQTGGVIQSNGNFEAGSFNGIPTEHTLTSVVQITGGTLNVTGNLAVANRMDAVFTMDDNAIVNAGTLQVAPGTAANSWGIANFKGGTLTTTQIIHADVAGTKAFMNFDGTVFRPTTNGTVTSSGAGVLNAASLAYVWNGGFIIDTNTQSGATITQRLLAPVGSGVLAAGSINNSGTYYAPPTVEISGDGSGASAIAQIDSNGQITAI